MKRLLPALAAMLLVLLSVAAGGVPQRADDTKSAGAIVPQIPTANRDDGSRVFLEHAAELRSEAWTPYQILVGDVEFSRDGMHMWCDSAHYYDATGSFQAFGNVKMQQGDTLYIYADTLHYDNLTRLATLLSAPRGQVRLINRDVTLTTPVFNYDMGLDLGYYDCGGVLYDKQNRLTSLEGEYSPSTKEAVFREQVRLTSLNRDDTLRIFTENLYYNTLTHIALLVDESTVVNADGIINTTNGSYNTETMEATLYDRSLVTYRNGNTLTGDTLYYDRETGRGEAIGNVAINDTTNHVLLTGDYGFALEPLDSAYVTGRARAIEYSTADSLFLHGDTIRVCRRVFERMVISTAEPDGVDVDSVAVDNISADNLTIDSLAVASDSVSAERMLLPIQVKADTTIVSDTVRYLTAAPRVRFFRRDLQGLCDSMTMVSTDSMLYMDRFPVIWNENRQIFGDRISVHFNDSTADRARVERNAMVIEAIEGEYYNQLAGKEMDALLIDGRLRHLDVSGNVQAIIFPEENDSTINKMLSLESSFMAADFVGKNIEIERMKLWPETNALVSPLYLTKRSQMYLKDFRLLEQFRPMSPDDIFNFSNELLEAMSQAPVVTPNNSTKPWNTTVPTTQDSLHPTSQSSTPIPSTSSTISTTVPQTSVQSPQPASDLTEPDLNDSIPMSSGESLQDS